MTTPRPSMTLNLIALSLACVFANGCSDTHKAPVQEPSVNSQADPFTEVETLTKLVDFSDQQQQSWLFGSHTSHQLIESVNNKQLALNFSAKRNISELKIAPPSPWDVSAYNNYNLAFDVQNTSSDSIHVYLSLENPHGQLQSRSVSLPANYQGTVYFPLAGKEAQTNAGMWGDAPP
ncbi:MULTISPECIES: hypothetical protein [unclassified Pseudoalteromonas]|uniref:hypothetical protein n=1 Tax=unclassified Pseudoalteromonas TaxID=194690 RepID=UPI00301B995D